jgi:thiol-disulfide isomerase/thioredoxin
MLKTSDDLLNMQKNLLEKSLIIIKFTADWCVPCKNIKSITHEYIKKLPSSINFIEIDIDESLDLYVFLKNKKMVNGIPAILAYYPGEKDNFYVPDDSCLGGNIDNVKTFFERCINYVK